MTADDMIKIHKDIKLTRTLILKDDVDGTMAEATLFGLRVLSRLDSQKPILLHIDSWGGNMDDCGAMVDAVNACPAPVYTICFGPAYSAAAMFLALGQPGRRAITPHGTVMFHTVKSGSDYDQPKNVEGYAAFTKKQFYTLAKEICKRSAFKYRDFKKAMDSNDEIWLTAREAKKKKVVDLIWTPAVARKFYRRANVDPAALKDVK
jgi:ATP-dependent protease ClpP protease subunit